MDTPTQICPAFADVLKSGRDVFNAGFAQARRQYPSLQPDVFSTFLVTCVDPLVRALAHVRPDALGAAVGVAYDTGLELVGQSLAGPLARQDLINEGWRRLLPAAAEAVAVAPGRVIGAVCNALHHLGEAPDARPLQWLAEMRLLAPQIGANVETLLKIGQVTAWRTGLAHFREGALVVADTLPDKLALLAVGAPEESDWPAVRAALRADPWHVPDGSEGGLRLAGRAGAFRGFGGLFLRPPEVASDGRQFYVRDGDEHWLLTADAFGATFHRATKEDFARTRGIRTVPERLQIVEGDGGSAEVRFHRRKIRLPISGTVRSSGATPGTLAVTTANSHAIVFVALPRE